MRVSPIDTEYLGDVHNRAFGQPVSRPADCIGSVRTVGSSVMPPSPADIFFVTARHTREVQAQLVPRNSVCLLNH